jgi:hypothetical protein
MHAQSVAWYAALVAAAALLYRRLLSPAWVAGLAALLYAVDDAHALPVTFLANRNALIAAFFGVLTIIAHDHGCRDRRRWGLYLAPALLALSLLSKEEGIGTCAYVAAYALFLDRRPVWRRAVTLLPYAAVVAVWRLTWSQLGYGVANVGFYVDPLHEPGRYLTAVVQRAPYLFLGQWATPPAELFIMENLVGVTLVRSLWWVGLGLATLLAFVLWPLLRRDATARFWGLGSLLALLPICTTFPADRMLLFPGLGAMALIAQFLTAVFSQAGASPTEPQRNDCPPRGGKLALPWRMAARGIAGLFVLFHVIVAPIALPIRVGLPTGPRFAAQFAMRAPLDAAIAQQDLVIVNAPSLLHAAYFPVERELRGEPVPRHMRYLGSGLEAMTIRRPDARTLTIRIDGGFIGWTFERLFRDERHPMAVSERVEVTGMTATVTALTPDGRPAEAAFRFNVPLEDRALRWLVWRDGEFQPFALPAIGETIELPRVRPGLFS